MAALVLKVKTKSDQQIIRSLSSTSTVQELKTLIAKLTDISESRLNILSGFPPKSLDLTNTAKQLSESGISSGDTLIVEELVKMENATAEKVAARPHTSDESLQTPGILMKHTVPADNSCLFTSIFYVMNGKQDDTGTAAPWMRNLIAESVAQDTDTYSEAMLGKPNKEYCKWIQDDKSWGGAIEIAILSNHYGIEIAVVDTTNGIINRFGEDQDYAHRVLLLFDGIHYDPLYLEPINGGEIQTIFPRSDNQILKDAELLATEAKSSRQYTDVNKFTLLCMDCNIHMNGQTQAQQHAQSTGHTNFREI